MAEPLKNNFGPDVVHRIADAVKAVHPSFDAKGFTKQSLQGFDDLELTPRAHQIADALGDFLPDDRGQALEILIDSFGPELENCDPDNAQPTGDPEIDENPMSGFVYMPHGYFIAKFGNDHFDQAMRANYELTKRFTAEFSVRAQLEHHTQDALALLTTWASDEHVHVRRLVSEGTRPRLPWASRLRKFQDDPAPVIALLELLKDDPVEYVRRSVANNLNDIAKDHPDLVVKIAKRWWKDGDHNRRRLVRHGLRTLIKAGDPGALDVLGYGPNSPARIATSTITPQTLSIGDKIKIEVSIENPSKKPCGALVDLQVHFVKANGSTSAKVFKGGEYEIEPGETAQLRKTISVAQRTTRTHYAGWHAVDALINGTAHPIDGFALND